MRRSPGWVHATAQIPLHSSVDWHHPEYMPRCGWEQRSVQGAEFERSDRYLHAQVEEIVTLNRPGVMWFDGEWERAWNHERGTRRFDLCHR